jgi:hypothetical protein
VFAELFLKEDERKKSARTGRHRGNDEILEYENSSTRSLSEEHDLDEDS